MKYIISESRLEKFIYEFISSNFEPDHGWQEHGWYKRSSERWGSISFDVRGQNAYDYFLLWDSSVKPRTLIIEGWLEKLLDELFGNNWDHVFMKWFSDNTGLPVEHLNVE